MCKFLNFDVLLINSALNAQNNNIKGAWGTRARARKGFQVVDPPLDYFILGMRMSPIKALRITSWKCIKLLAHVTYNPLNC